MGVQVSGEGQGPMLVPLAGACAHHLACCMLTLRKHLAKKEKGEKRGYL